MVGLIFEMPSSWRLSETAVIDLVENSWTDGENLGQKPSLMVIQSWIADYTYS